MDVWGPDQKKEVRRGRGSRKGGREQEGEGKEEEEGKSKEEEGKRNGEEAKSWRGGGGKKREQRKGSLSQATPLAMPRPTCGPKGARRAAVRRRR